MCVAAIAWDAHPDLKLVAIGNRDEFHERPSAPLARWKDQSGIIAGRDLRAGGTWLGVSEAGRFALLTNFSNPDGLEPRRASRGALVAAYLTGSPLPHLAEMNPFNLFCADQEGARLIASFPEPSVTELSAGIHGISNGPVGKPWPKTLQLCTALDRWLSGSPSDMESLFAALRAETARPAGPPLMQGPAPDYAPVFIRNRIYGTRCSTVVAIARDGKGVIVERSFDADGAGTGERSVVFSWPRG